jgi:hypothetical protein
MDKYSQIINAIKTKDDVLRALLNDPSHAILSDESLDIDKLLLELSTNKNTFDAIIHKNLEDINNDIYSFFKSKLFSDEQTNEYCHRLLGYRMINELYELHKGKPVKIFDLKTNKLKMGGIVCNIHILDSGINILCKNMNMPGKFMQYKYNEHITFQMLSQEEQLILLINEKILENGRTFEER